MKTSKIRFFKLLRKAARPSVPPTSVDGFAGNKFGTVPSRVFAPLPKAPDLSERPAKNTEDYEQALAAKDARIAELETKL